MIWDPKRMYAPREPQPVRDAPRPASERPTVTVRKRRQRPSRVEALDREATKVLAAGSFVDYDPVWANRVPMPAASGAVGWCHVCDCPPSECRTRYTAAERAAKLGGWPGR